MDPNVAVPAMGASIGAATFVNYLVDIAYVAGPRVMTGVEIAALGAVIAYVAGVATWAVLRKVKANA